ncbi:hypothetical protein PT273_08890 [Orbaceae bacterium ESL0727]|nr:hypothetical protein [Orbaceae bacterium ESL0727]MDF7667954.1 hypothetical protein [Orbaceae bacterium ESL0727]
MKITMEHIRAGGGCAWGLREFFKRYDLDINEFVKNGYIESEKLLATNDDLAIKVVEKAMNKKVTSNGR